MTRHLRTRALLVLLATTPSLGCLSTAKENNLEFKILEADPPDSIHFQVRNNANQTLTFFTSHLQIVDATGKRLGLDYEAQRAVPAHQRLRMKELLPGETVEGVVTFAGFQGKPPYTLLYDGPLARGEVRIE